jgi:hypothetical protein
MHERSDLRHPDSPRGPELRDPNAFFRAVGEGLPPEHGAFVSGVSARLVLNVDATGTVTSAHADASTDPAVGRAVIAAVRLTGLLPAQRDGVAHAVQDHRMQISLRAAALRPRGDAAGPRSEVP